MKVTIERGHINSVSIEGGIADPLIDMQLSPQHAYALLLALDLQREELRDLAENFWECPDCGGSHQKMYAACPYLSE